MSSPHRSKATKNHRHGRSRARRTAERTPAVLLAVGTLVTGILTAVAAIVRSATSEKRGHRR